MSNGLKLLAATLLLSGCADEREEFKKHPVAVTLTAAMFAGVVAELSK